MDLKAIASALMGSVNTPVNYGANVNDAGGNAQVTQNIRNLGSLQGQGDASNRAIGALGASANQQDQNEQAAAADARRKAESDLKSKEDEIKRLSDPANYKAIINEVGGYDFYNPDNQKISPVDYAKATNKQITELYKDSQDPNDRDFTEDYKKVLELGKIIQNGDKDARDKFYKKNPEWKEAYGSSTYNDIVKDLRAEYPGYFRGDQEMMRQDNYDNKTPEGKDDRNFVKRSVDQLLPSFLGNKSNYNTRG